MIKTILLFLLSFIFTGLISCKKDVSPNTPPTDTAAPGAYLPLTKDTYWRYSNTGFTNDTSVVTMLGITNVIDGITYEAALSETNSEKDTAYYAVKGHDYYAAANVEGHFISMLILNDSLNVNGTWTVDFITNTLPGRGNGKIIEKGISLTVNGNTYQNVIHTSYVLQFSFLNTYIDIAYYDFYFAKDIGIIRIDSKTSTDGSNFREGNTSIIDYRIK